MRQLTPELVLNAYAHGVFPMAESRDDPRLHWIDPEMRGILPLDAFHVPRRLARTIRAERFRISADQCFDRVILACATPARGRGNSWINDRIVGLYHELHRLGHAHSLECWHTDELVGGLYGVSLGAAFFGESMFSRARDASKVALVHLVARLIAGRFQLLDTQFVTKHLSRFGAIEIERADYLDRLNDAITMAADFHALSKKGIAGDRALELITARSKRD